MRKKEAKTSNGDKKPRKPKPGATAKTAEKSKTSTKPKTKPAAKPAQRPKPTTKPASELPLKSKPASKPSPKPKPLLKPETVAKPYPEGKTLRCTVHYTIYYIGSHKPTARSEPFTEPCRLVFKNIIIDLPLSVAAASAARAKLWDDWVDFRNRLEEHPPVNSPAKIDWIRIDRTEYSAGKEGDAKITTGFIDEYVRSVPGYTDIPRDF